MAGGPGPAVARWTLQRPGGVTLAVAETGDPAVPAAVLAHGAGSTAEFVRRCFGAALTGIGLRLVAYDLRGHGASTPVRDIARLGADEHADDLAALADRVDAAIVGGISLGAHAATRVAAGRVGLRGLLCALPAWTGAPDAVAMANAAQADELTRLGLAAALARIGGQAGAEVPGWVAEELSASWPRHDERAFVAVLRALATAPAPDEAALRAVGAPAGVVTLAGDPLHPAAVARHWAATLPRAAFAEVPAAAVGADRAALGHAVVDALHRAGYRA